MDIVPLGLQDTNLLLRIMTADYVDNYNYNYNYVDSDEDTEYSDPDGGALRMNKSPSE